MRNYEKEVSIKLLEIMTSESVEKIVLMDLFFQNYPSQLSNQDKAKVKKYLIELIQYLETQGVIESNYQYIHQGKFIQTKQLTTQLISEGFVIYEIIII